MELIYYNQMKKNIFSKELVAAIGQFDGLHIAHMKLLTMAKQLADKNGYQSAMITFDPHPDFILKKNLDTTYITPLEEKIEVLSAIGLDYMIIIPFNETVAMTEPVEFVKNYLLDIHVCEVVVGFDFQFGRYGGGKAKDITTLSGNKIVTHIVAEMKYHDEKIGTSKVRSLLAEGKVDEVKEWLGRFYQIKGTVVTGNRIGRTLHIPTANIHIDEDFVKVKPGVYGVIVTVQNKKYVGITNLGHNPSFNYQKHMILETHIIDFNEEIYGEEIKVDFVMYLREERAFPSKEMFAQQIALDKARALSVIKPLISMQK